MKKNCAFRVLIPVFHLVSDGGRLVVAHVGIKEEMIGRASGAQFSPVAGLVTLFTAWVRCQLEDRVGLRRGQRFRQRCRVGTTAGVGLAAQKVDVVVRGRGGFDSCEESGGD